MFGQYSEIQSKNLWTDIFIVMLFTMEKNSIPHIPQQQLEKKIWHILKMNIAINNHVIREWGNEAKMLHNMKKDRVRS